jgi:hypothetical protein
MWEFKKATFKTIVSDGTPINLCYDELCAYSACTGCGVIILDPFDYIIVTFNYTPPLSQDFDLDSLTAIRPTNSVLSGGLSSVPPLGILPSTQIVGCGTGNFSSPPQTTSQNSFLFWGGDDNNQNQDGTFGESVVINLKNLKNSGITTLSEVDIDLFAGWHSNPNSVYPITLKYETFTGGTITKEIVNGVTTNRFVTTGQSISRPQISNPINIISGTCGEGVDIKRKIGTIRCNLLTGDASISFFSF